MKRREFLASATALSLGTLGGHGIAGNRDPAGSAGRTDIGLVGGVSPEQLLEEYRSDLFNRFLPNLEESVVDHKYGGFMCDVDIRTGERLSTNKRAWYEGRGMWMYSYLYNHIEQDPRFLDIAEKSKDFVLRHQPGSDTFWTASFNREGEPISGPGNIYGDLFVAEGLAEYAAATGEGQYLNLAKELIFKCVDLYDRPDYRFHNRTSIGPEIYGPRVLGHWMLFLIASTHILNHVADPDIERLADRSVDAIMNHHMNSDYHLLNEFLNHDFSLPGNEFDNFVYLGVSIETLWMVLYEAVRRRDEELYQRTAESFKRHVTVARDAVYGGYFRSLDRVDDHVLQVDKVLWLQEEVLIGTLSMIEHSNDSWAHDCFAETYAYVQDTYVRPGYKFWIHAGDRTVSEFGGKRVENYHHPRHLMLNLLSLERIAGRGGNTSGLIG
ncbi:MAG: AGE family epimerase/isomerase [Balneolaceae bacterium]